MRALLALAIAAGFLVGSGCDGISSNPVIDTTEGPVTGLFTDRIHSFKGIPYATPPVGELRWRAPQPPPIHAETLAAKDFGRICSQRDMPALGHRSSDSSEDCLTLNIWTPDIENTAGLPVMVWIHGGGYVSGSSNTQRLNGAALAKKDVVLVSINYRLNAFGFFTHPAITKAQANEAHANYGLLDVIAALTWVQNNVEQFGGDKNNVTIFGESAGANIVDNLLIMPQADGLYQKAISQSSSFGLAPEPDLEKRIGFLPSGDSAGKKMVERLGLSDLDDESLVPALRQLTAEQLINAVPANERFTPVVDRHIRPQQAGLLFGSGQFAKVPYMSGSVSWEASLGHQIGGNFAPKNFARLIPKADKERLYADQQGAALEDAIFTDLIILSPTRYVANAMQNAGAPVWRYHMTYVAEERRDAQPGVAHADDIAFVMQTLDKDLEQPTATDWNVSKVMSDYWVQFARTGNPNFDGAVNWESYEAERNNVLIFDEQPVIEEDFFAERMDFQNQRSYQFLLRMTGNK